jgi:hypothetical protein
MPPRKLALTSALSAIALAIAVACITCTKAPIAGDVTETGNAVAGLIIDANHYPAHNAVVRLVPVSFDPVKDQALPDSLSDTTDSLGRYTIRTKRDGTFNVIAFRPNDGSSAMVRNITLASDSTIEIPTGILSSSGAVSVQAPRGADSTLGYVYMQGTTISASLGAESSTGMVLMSGVPAGNSPSIYYSSTNAPSAAVLLADSATVSSGDTCRIYRVNRGAGLFIGIDPWNTGYPVLLKNPGLFDVNMFNANGGVTNGWYTWAPNGGYLSNKLLQTDTLGMRPAVIYQQMSEALFDSMKAEFNNQAYMNAYFTQYISALQMLNGKKAIIIVEPISMAYSAQRAYSYPATCLPSMEYVYVKSSGVSQVQNYADNEAGFFQACVGLAHSIAPDASVGIFLMNWALWTTASTLELVYWTPSEQSANVTAWANYLGQLGIMNNVDFISLGKDRYDAAILGVNSPGYWNSPQFTSFLNYSASVRDAFGKPLVGWYLPIGHRGLPNTPNRYEDTFAEYFFANAKSFTDAGYVGMLFGKYDILGTDLTDTPGTGDDGWFITQEGAFRAK